MSSGMDGRSSNGRTLVIGIDFGTTFSSAAYSISDRPDRMHPCTSWSTVHEEQQTGDDQVPTIIRYLPRGNFEWGPQVRETTPPDEKIMRWFKLYVSLFGCC